MIPSPLTDEQQAQRAQKAKALADDQAALAREFYVTFTSPSGRVVWQTLRAKGRRPILEAHGPDAQTDEPCSWRNVGLREMADYIEDMIEAGRRGPESREEPTHAESALTE